MILELGSFWSDGFSSLSLCVSNVCSFRVKGQSDASKGKQSLSLVAASSIRHAHIQFNSFLSGMEWYVGTHRCVIAVVSVKAASGMTEMSLPCGERILRLAKPEKG